MIDFNITGVTVMEKSQAKIMKTIIYLAIYHAVIASGLFASDSITVSSQIYKTIGETELKIHIFYPHDLKTTEKRSAFIFFHGGGWVQGTPEWGYNHCKHFASLGMAAFSVEYRLAPQNNVTPVEIVADAKSAVRWVRSHAKELGVDPEKIIASGMSAGGHLAACTGIIEGYDEPTENLSISSKPNALVLLSAPVNPAVDKWFIHILNNKVNPKELSPAHHVRSGLPPTILFNGTADKTVPYSTAKDFEKIMLNKGNICKLYTFEKCDHLLSCIETDRIYTLIDSFLVKNKMISKTLTGIIFKK